MKRANYLKRTFYFLSLFISSAVLFTACSEDSSDGPSDPVVEGDQTIAEVTQLNDAYTILGEAIEAAGLTGALSGDGPFTIFAPTDAAFAALPEGTLESLTAEQLAQILQFHVVEGAITSSQLSSTQDVNTLLGQEILVEAGGGVTVNDEASVVVADFMASNGIIHAIDQVLLPKGFREANIFDVAEDLEDFSTLVGALTDTGLETTFQYKGDFTVFAPTDNAFEQLPDGLLESLTTEQLVEVLSYHVLSGETPSNAVTRDAFFETLAGDNLFIEREGENLVVNNSANVGPADVTAENGVIHAIDQVILPDSYGTIVDAAIKRYQLETLVNALVSTGLNEALDATDASFTVFAPTEEAFAKLPDGLLASLTTQQLTEILQYHVVEGSVAAGDLSSSQDVSTLNGEEIFVTAGGEVQINNTATVQTADITTQNGIIHTIDEVLLPAGYREANIIDQANELGSFTTLVSSLEQVGLTSTFKYTGDYTVFAPTDAAFGELPMGLLESLTDEQLTEILSYHVLSGTTLSTDLDSVQTVEALSGENVFVTSNMTNGVIVNGSSNVSTADVEVTNGVIHAVDQVILPNEFSNVVQIASKDYGLSTLVGLVADAGLVPTLEGDGPFTVFAPTNAAFDSVASTLASLSEAQVREVLEYHVVAAEALAGDLMDGQTFTTVQGEDITVNIDESGTVTFNSDAGVVTVDLQGTNGVVHIIDKVLLPPSYQN